MSEELLEVMRESDEPFLTAGEIVEKVDVTRKTVNTRLVELANEGEINRKKVGSRAVVYWLPERYQSRKASVRC